MARFTLRERPGTGTEVPDPDPPFPQPKPPNNVGDQILFIDVELEDKKGNLVGTLVSRCTIVQRFAQNDVLVAFTATNKLNKGMINTQGVIRLNDFTLPNGVTFAIVGGDPQVQEGSRHGDREIRSPNNTLFTFRVF